MNPSGNGVILFLTGFTHSLFCGIREEIPRQKKGVLFHYSPSWQRCFKKLNWHH